MKHLTATIEFTNEEREILNKTSKLLAEINEYLPQDAILTIPKEYWCDSESISEASDLLNHLGNFLVPWTIK